MGNTVKVATSAISTVFEKQVNLEKILSMIKEAATNGSRLIVFPECAIQKATRENLVGPITSDGILYQQENAELVPEGESTQKIMKAAKENNIYVIYGLTERDHNQFDVLYNTGVLVGPEGFIGKYSKVHVALCENHFWQGGTEFPVFDTEIGKIGMMICYDRTFPEATRELALGGADILVCITAWIEEFGEESTNVPGKVGTRYDMYDAVRAMENQLWLISSNQVGKWGERDFYGHSNIVNPYGYIISTTGADECIAYADIDVKGGILKNRVDMKQHFLLDMKPKTYKNLKKLLDD